jgi:hypothetical protein
MLPPRDISAVVVSGPGNKESAMSKLVILVGLSACFFMPKRMQVVPASQAPAPPQAGTGWSCFDYQQVRLDTHDGTSQTSAHDLCTRTFSECQQSAAELARPDAGGSRTQVSNQVGSCVTQQVAACTYVWDGKGTHECYRSLDSCQRNVGGFVGGGDMKQSECAEYQ